MRIFHPIDSIGDFRDQLAIRSNLAGNETLGGVEGDVIFQFLCSIRIHDLRGYVITKTTPGEGGQISLPVFLTVASGSIRS